jgi:pSer/pThr/pTyr-binding forkhead associated (FHA) protein
VQKSERNPYADRISIGRAQSCDIVLRHPSVSKLHGHFLQIEGGHWGIRDASSRNGIRVNGERVASNAPTKISADDRIRIGALDVRFVYPAGLYKILRGERPVSTRPPPRR